MTSVVEKYINKGWVLHSLNGKKPVTLAWDKPGTITLDNCKSKLKPKCNIGVLCGEVSGVVVFDIDVIKDKDKKDLLDGVKEWNKYLVIHKWPKTPVSITGSGGYHVYFKYDERTAKLRAQNQGITNDKGERIKWDFLGQRSDGIYTNAVLPPSIHPDTNKPYVWMNKSDTFDVASMPDWLYNILWKSQNPQVVEKEKKEKVDEVYDSTFTKKDVENRVELLTCYDDYDDWVKIAHYLKGCSIILGDEDWGLDLYDSFSQKSDKYDSEEVQKKWDSIKKNLSTDSSYGSLCKMAKRDNSEGFAKLYDKSYLILHGEKGCAEYLGYRMKNNFKCVNIKANDYYIYNSKVKLWVESAKEQMFQPAATILIDKINEKKKEIQEMLEDDGFLDIEKKIFEIERNDLTKVLNRVCTCAGIKAICTLLKSYIFDPEFEKNINKFSYLLPIREGLVVDLRTGLLLPRLKEHYFTKECPVSYGTGVYDNEVQKLFEDIMFIYKDKIATQEKVAYFQNILGMMITGEQSDMMFIFHGAGRNGKSLIMTNILQAILDDFASPISKDAFIKKTGYAAVHQEHLMPLIGSRLVYCSETEEGDQLNESSVKSITGDDATNPRGCGEKSKKIITRAKPVLLTNHRPTFNPNDEAILDRLRYVPFNTRFTDKPDKKKYNEKLIDRSLRDLISEKYLPDILKWIVQGSIQYYKDRSIPEPQSIKAAKNEYIGDMDDVSKFINEYMVMGTAQKGTELFSKYTEYSVENQYRPVGRKNFYERLRDACTETKVHNAACFELKPTKNKKVKNLSSVK